MAPIAAAALLLLAASAAHALSAAFAPGETQQTRTLHAVDDAAPEPPETVTLTVAPGAHYTLGGDTTLTYTIADNDQAAWYHDADVDRDFRIGLGELLRIIQFFNAGGYRCAEDTQTEDGYLPGAGTPPADYACGVHDADSRAPAGDIELSELLRVVQFFNVGGYHYDPAQESEDGFLPGEEPR